MRKTGKREFLLAALILLAAALLWLLKAKPSNAPAAVLEISVDGNLAETLDLIKTRKSRSLAFTAAPTT